MTSPIRSSTPTRPPSPEPRENTDDVQILDLWKNHFKPIAEAGNLRTTPTPPNSPVQSPRTINPNSDQKSAS